jgi:hypothetical protein
MQYNQIVMVLKMSLWLICDIDVHAHGSEESSNKCNILL